MASTTASSTIDPKPPLRHRKSGGNWFKRKSSMFLNGDLEAVDENQRPDTRDSKRVKETSLPREAGGVREMDPPRGLGPPRVAGPPPPLLPEIGSLRGGRISEGGDLGWDEGAFKR